MATCFVIMGFKTKTDLATGRSLNLDATYEYIIKPTVELCGLTCVRADEIPHSGVIDVPMYEQLLDSDLVIADISTANPNALYELGVRHALRPRATIIIAEDGFKYPFDLSHIVIRSYKHLGEDVGAGEVKRFSQVLAGAIRAWQAESSTASAALQPDSPVYTFLKNLKPPLRESGDKVTQPPEGASAGAVRSVAAVGSAAPDAQEESLATIIDQGEQLIADGRFSEAKELFTRALRQSRPSSDTAVPGTIAHVGDPYLIHRLTLATYKAKQPDEITALREAIGLLAPLNLADTNDPETLGVAGAIEKRLYNLGEGIEHLNLAIRYYERGFILRDDYYNGINLAYLLDVHAGTEAAPTDTDKIADLVMAGRIRRHVLTICGKAVEEVRLKRVTLAGLPANDPQRTAVDDQLYWILATEAEACCGLAQLEEMQSSGDLNRERLATSDWTRRCDAARKMAAELNRPGWMVESTNTQMEKLAALIKRHEGLFRKLAGT